MSTCSARQPSRDILLPAGHKRRLSQGAAGEKLVVSRKLLRWQYSSQRLLKSNVRTGYDLARPWVQPSRHHPLRSIESLGCKQRCDSQLCRHCPCSLAVVYPPVPRASWLQAVPGCVQGGEFAHPR